MTANREHDSLDFLKLILSFMVAAIHSGLFFEHIYPAARLAVPAFFTLTGYFAFGKIDHAASPELKKEILKKTIRRNLGLYFSWTILLFPLIYYMRGFLAMGISKGMPAMLLSVMKGVSFVGSWYIFASVIALAIVFLLSHFLSNGALLLLSLPFYLIGTACAEFPFVYHVPILGKAIEALSIPFGAPYFSYVIALLYIVMGKIIADQKGKQQSIMVSFVAFAVCAAGLQLEFLFVEKAVASAYHRDCYLMLAPTAYFLVKFLERVPAHFQNAAAMRKLSTITYCTHGVVLAVVSKVLKIGNITDSSNIGLFLCTIAICSGIGVCILKLEQKPGMAFLRCLH